MVIDFLKDEAHKNAWSVVKKEVIRLLIFLKPKKINGKVRFGLEDPYVTGQILAVLSVLYPFYAESLEIYPEFEQKVLEGNINIKGKIRGIYAVIVAFNIIINNVLRFWVRFRQTMYGDESYLTHTLPVEKNTLYASKMLSAFS